MQIDQIILRPSADVILLQHTDSAGRSAVTPLAPASLDAKQAEALATFLALCRTAISRLRRLAEVALGRVLAQRLCLAVSNRPAVS